MRSPSAKVTAGNIQKETLIQGSESLYFALLVDMMAPVFGHTIHMLES